MFEQYYGLSANPFQLTPDPRFYFESGTHRKALSYLGYGLAQGEGFIVITGEIGAGKTTLVGHLMATVDKARLTAAHIVTTSLEAKDMVEMAAESFGIDTRELDKAATLKAIELFLHAEARAGRRCLLVVDEAQNLPADALEELRMLSNFQLGSSALLQIFLLGQPEFREMIDHDPKVEQLRQRIIATHHLAAMDADEIEPYIVHRLSRVGWNGRPDITPEAVAMLYRESGGIPRKLNSLLSRLLLMGAVEQVDLLDERMLSDVIADQKRDSGAQDAANATPMPVIAQAPVAQHSILPEQGAPHIMAASDALPTAEADTAPPAAAPAAPVVAKAPMPVAVTAVDDRALKAAEARIASLEARVEEQDAAIRRVLAMLIDWVEHDVRQVEQRRGRAA